MQTHRPHWLHTPPSRAEWQGQGPTVWTQSSSTGQINSFQDTHCRQVAKSFTCNCDNVPSFNMSRWMYWYCPVSRTDCEDRNHKVRLAILTVLAGWVKYYLLSDLGSDPPYVDEQLLSRTAPHQGLRGELRLCVVPSIPSMASSPWWEPISSQGMGGWLEKAGLTLVLHRGVQRLRGPRSFSADTIVPLHQKRAEWTGGWGFKEAIL